MSRWKGLSIRQPQKLKDIWLRAHLAPAAAGNDAARNALALAALSRLPPKLPSLRLVVPTLPVLRLGMLMLPVLQLLLPSVAAWLPAAALAACRCPCRCT